MVYQLFVNILHCVDFFIIIFFPLENFSLFFFLKGLYRKNEWGFRIKPENLRFWTILIRHLSYVPDQYFSQWQCCILVTWFPIGPRDIDTALSLAKVIVLSCTPFHLSFTVPFSLNFTGPRPTSKFLVTSISDILTSNIL